MGLDIDVTNRFIALYVSRPAAASCRIIEQEDERRQCLHRRIFSKENDFRKRFYDACLWLHGGDGTAIPGTALDSIPFGTGNGYR